MMSSRSGCTRSCSGIPRSTEPRAPCRQATARAPLAAPRAAVGTSRQKREAQKAAERVCGVTAVRNQLEVRIVDEHGRQDADLRGAVLQAMALDGLLPGRK